MTQLAITSIDNPYDPFTEFESWVTYDVQMGYFTCERLASIVHNLPDSLTQDENNFFIEKAIDELLKAGCYNKKGEFVEYKKLTKETED